jgi:hypothetical protein
MRLANRLLLKRRIDRESAASMLALREMAEKHRPCPEARA